MKGKKDGEEVRGNVENSKEKGKVGRNNTWRRKTNKKKGIKRGKGK